MPVNHTVRIKPHERSISAPEDLPVLSAAQRAGLPLPHSCRSGRCGSCRARLLSGQIEYPAGPPLGLSAEESRQGYVLLCQALARSDLVLEARLVQSVAEVELKRLPARIARRVALAPDVIRLVLRVPAVEPMTFRPGQYLDVILEDGRRRSYSVANAGGEGSQFELHVRHVPGGAFSDAVFGSLREGALLTIEGPLGRFTYEEGAGPVLFIAGGTGFAPIKAMLGQALSAAPARELHLYWGAREASGIYEEALLSEWAQRHPRLTIHTVLSDVGPQANRRTGPVHEAVLADHPQLSAFEVYAAGPQAMIAVIKTSFPAHGADPGRLHLDAFDPASDV